VTSGDKSSIDTVAKAMKDGSSFMIYPEGKRSSDPTTILPFKTGAFRLAQKTQAPILPVVLKGTGKAMPIGGICNFSNLEMVICDQVKVSDKYENIKAEPNIEKVRNQMQEYVNTDINSKSSIVPYLCVYTGIAITLGSLIYNYI
jgi:1-acyl-sn-glycerol-3-phosphate acyltransferase